MSGVSQSSNVLPVPLGMSQYLGIRDVTVRKYMTLTTRSKHTVNRVLKVTFWKNEGPLLTPLAPFKCIWNTPRLPHCQIHLRSHISFKQNSTLFSFSIFAPKLIFSVIYNFVSDSHCFVYIFYQMFWKERCICSLPIFTDNMINTDVFLFHSQNIYVLFMLI